MDRRIDSDLAALAETSRRDLPSLDQTARALRDARNPLPGGRLMSLIRNPTRVAALGIATLAAALVCPVPYTHTVGYDLAVRASDGRTTRVRLPRTSAASAERRAAALRARGALVTVEPRTERVWGAVYAMANEKVLHIVVDTDGKTDAEVESEVRAQIEQSGWAADGVVVQRDGAETTVRIDANDGDGRVLQVVGKESGGHLEVRAGDLDDTREPGMTDEQLRQKILRQLAARGMDAEVTVKGDEIDIRAHKRAPLVACRDREARWPASGESSRVASTTTDVARFWERPTRRVGEPYVLSYAHVTFALDPAVRRRRNGRIWRLFHGATTRFPWLEVQELPQTNCPGLAQS